MKNPIAKLLLASREIYALRSATALLAWDQETKMPPSGGEGRAQALGALSTIIHEKYCSKRLADLLEDSSQDSGLTESQIALVRELKRDRDKAVKIPASLTEELARSTSLSQMAWAKARPLNDTKSFNPWLQKVFALRKQEAECLGYENHAYDALLNQYEPGAKSEELKILFADLKNSIVPLLQKIIGASSKPLPKLTSYPIEKQKKVNAKILSDMGFDLQAGRLDESAHPFTEGVYPTDVRLTTRYFEDNFLSSIFSTLHEGGHGLYEQGFRTENFGTPLGEATSLGIHESQSRLWENQVGRSHEFWEYYAPLLQKELGDGFSNTQSLMQIINHVKPSLIRVEADEVTYNLHIILRFELEIALFNGELQVADLEAAWNEGMQKSFGFAPDSPSNGYMQDVHWSCGLIGYFPTYTLGNLCAAQLFNKVQENISGLNDKIRQGQFSPLQEWLKINIHQYGRQFSGDELMKKATGESMQSHYFANYLKRKYAP